MSGSIAANSNHHASDPIAEINGHSTLSHDVNDYAHQMDGDMQNKLGIGCIVEDLDKAYLLYCQYAHKKGFSVRKGRQRYIGKSDDILWKEFVCSASGLPDSKRSCGRVPDYRKMISRTGCKAKIKVGRVDRGPWAVSIFDDEHNHPLVPTDQAYMLRSARTVTPAQQSILEALHSVRIGVSKSCGFIEKESGGMRNVGFTRRDAYDHIRRFKRSTKVPNGDSNAMLEYFSSKSAEDPCFYHKAEVDDEGRLMNFFFRDSTCADDYDSFGDVLSIDTTYRTNRYNLVCAPFVGINHHGYNVMFGMAFLSDETTSSFEWLFNAFLHSMNGKEPTIIFTDQCQAMMNAIDKCFPNSRHRLCQWHINQNAPSHFGKLNGDSAFKTLWHKCMNHVDSEEEFEEVWSDMVNGYLLCNNKWFRSMYDLRRRWASVFSSGVFTGGLLATSRSEVTNRVLKDLARSSESLSDFIVHYESIQSRWHEKERAEDTMCLLEPGQFVANNPLLRHAASIYTRRVYKKFEFEASSTFNVELRSEYTDIGDGEVQVTASNVDETGHNRIVKFNVGTHHARCSCRMYENQGILCRHILKVYYTRNVRAIPDAFILKRWTKHVKDRSRMRSGVDDTGDVMPHLLFVNNLMRSVYRLATVTKDNLSARQHLQRMIDIAGDDIHAMVENPVVAKKKTQSFPIDTSTFCDPAPLPGRGFDVARQSRYSNDRKRKGKRKAQQRIVVSRPSKSTTKTKAKSCVSLEVDNTVERLEDFPSDGDALYRNFSQP